MNQRAVILFIIASPALSNAPEGSFQNPYPISGFPGFEKVDPNSFQTCKTCNSGPNKPKPRPEGEARDISYDYHRNIRPKPEQKPTRLYEDIEATRRVRIRDERYLFTRSVIRRKREIRERAQRETRLLSKPWRGLALNKFADSLERASENLQLTAQALANGKSDLLGDEQDRYQKLVDEAADRAAKARAGMTDQQLQYGLAPNFPFQGAITEQNWNPLVPTVEISNVFNPNLAFSDPTSREALVDRMVKLYGLPSTQREKIDKELRLVDRVRIGLPDGSEHLATLPNSGYALGRNSDYQVDCSSFVSQALESHIGKGHFTTLDFKQMWHYRRDGRLLKEGKYSPERSKLIRRTALGFDAINLYRGQFPMPGDILFYRFKGQNRGHVYVVLDYNPRNYEVRVVEAAQSAGAVRERTLNLTFNGKDGIYLRQGIYILRIKPTRRTACLYAKR